MQGNYLFIAFELIILIFSVVIHEVAHGAVADSLGDPTARLAGRLTLNPLPHLDLYGSVLLPLVTFLVAGIAFGSAKPVPYNPYNLRNGKRGEVMVAAAGPLSNLLIALFFGLVVRFDGAYYSLPAAALLVTQLIVIVNISLAVFNLIPLPPLDGSRILLSVLPQQAQDVIESFRNRSFIFTMIFVVFFWGIIAPPVVGFLFKLITGIALS